MFAKIVGPDQILRIFFTAMPSFRPMIFIRAESGLDLKISALVGLKEELNRGPIQSKSEKKSKAQPSKSDDQAQAFRKKQGPTQKE